MAGTSIGAQVLKEVQEMREDIHRIDTKLEVHIARDEANCGKVDKLTKDIYNNNGKGMKTKLDTMWDEFSDKSKTGKEVKIRISTGIILLILTVVINAIVGQFI